MHACSILVISTFQWQMTLDDDHWFCCCSKIFPPCVRTAKQHLISHLETACLTMISLSLPQRGMDETPAPAVPHFRLHADSIMMRKNTHHGYHHHHNVWKRGSVALELGVVVSPVELSTAGRPVCLEFG
jgi:hypothetical protein